MGRRGSKAFKRTLREETAMPTGRVKFGEEQTTPTESRTTATLQWKGLPLGTRKWQWEYLVVAAII